MELNSSRMEFKILFTLHFHDALNTSCCYFPNGGGFRLFDIALSNTCFPRCGRGKSNTSVT